MQPEQTSEILEMLESIADSVYDVTAENRFMCNPWDVFGDVLQPGLIDAVPDTEPGSDGAIDLRPFVDQNSPTTSPPFRVIRLS